MEENEDFQPAKPQQQHQLGLLKFLCILTFLGSGVQAFIYSIFGLFYNFLKSVSYEKLQKSDSELFRDMNIDPEVAMAYTQQLFTTGRQFMLLNALTFTCSFYGAILMWKLRKAGFHLYTIAQIIALILPLIYIHGFRTPFGSILITVVFIFAYSSFLKHMK